MCQLIRSDCEDIDLRRRSPVRSGSPSASRPPPAPQSPEPPPQPPDPSSAARGGSLCPRQRIQSL